MYSVQIALISYSTTIAQSEVVKVASILNRQVNKDFSPIWEVKACVEYHQDLPAGYYPIYLYDDIQAPDLLGYHTTDDNQLPYAVVQSGPSWSLAASHECLEMIFDPQGQQLRWSLLP